MDEELRKRAKQIIANAERLYFSKQEKVAEYRKGIDLYLKISNKNLEDIKAIVEAHHSLANLYFNAKEYVNAGQNYLEAINQLVQTPLNDDSYRNLTELYIDLADACYEMMNQSAGDEAMTNAIKAFGLIRNKTIKEQEIGDPVTHFKEFHAYYEKKLSTKSYLKSAEFINHEYLLGEAQVARKQEQELFSGLESLSLGERQEIDQSIENMLSKLSLTVEQPIFSTVSITKDPIDSDYRGMAMQVLNLARSYVQKDKIPDAISTSRQVINILKAIKTPQQSDLEIIEDLTQKIKNKFHSSPPLTHQTVQMPVSVATTGLGFFDHRAPESTYRSTAGFYPDDEKDEEDYDMDMSM